MALKKLGVWAGMGTRRCSSYITHDFGPRGCLSGIRIAYICMGGGTSPLEIRPMGVYLGVGHLDRILQCCYLLTYSHTLYNVCATCRGWAKSGCQQYSDTGPLEALQHSLSPDCSKRPTVPVWKPYVQVFMTLLVHCVCKGIFQCSPQHAYVRNAVLVSLQYATVMWPWGRKDTSYCLALFTKYGK